MTQDQKQSSITEIEAKKPSSSEETNRITSWKNFIKSASNIIWIIVILIN